MEFETKRALLEYLGKNKNDNKLIDRMMLRWEVYKEDGMYHYVTSKKNLIEENKELKLELMRTKKASLSDMERWELTKLIKENMELKKVLKEEKINSEYYNRLYEEEKEDKYNKIRKCFRWIKQIKSNADWEEFRDWVMNDEE